MALPFCPDTFFDYNVTWYTKYPDLTECFKDTLVRWLPLAWLVVTLPLGLPALLKAQRPLHLADTPISVLQIVRVLLALAFLGVCVADIVYSAIVSSWFVNGSVVMILAPAFEAASMVVAIGFYVLEYWKLYFRSPAFFIYWLMEFFAYIILTYTASINLAYNTGHVLPTHAAFIYTRWLLSIASFIVCCLSPMNNLPGERKPYASENCVLVQVEPKAKKHSKTASEENSKRKGQEALEQEPQVRQKLRTLCPEEYTSHASFLTFMWFLPLVIRGFRTALKTSDLWLLRKTETTVYNRELFCPRWEAVMRKWRQEQAAAAAEKKRVEEALCASPVLHTDTSSNPQMMKSENVGASLESSSNNTEKKEEKEKEPLHPPLFAMICRIYGMQFLFGQFIMFVYVFVYYINPCLLWVFIKFMSDQTIELWKGYMIAVIFFIVQVMQSMLFQQHYHIMVKISVRIRAAIIDTLYRKTLSVAPSSMASSGTGDFVNFLAIDLQRVQDTLQYIYFVWFAPLNTALSILLLWFQIGWICFVGLAMMGGCILINFLISLVLKRILEIVMIAKDQRVRFMNELLNGIKVVKLYSWEKAFSKVISQYRAREILLFIRFFLLQSGIMVIFLVTPFILTAATFLIYTHVHGDDPDNQLDAVRAFMTLSLYNLLQVPIGFLPTIITFVSAASIAINRIAVFLGLPDANPDSVLHVENEETKANPIIVENGEFSWNENGETILTKIDLKVRKGELVAVVGAVGSGKSSLLTALLGEMVKVNGQVNVSSRKIAYVAQSAWMQNTTLKNNIIFGMAFDQKRYDDTLDACALVSDLKVLPGGDSTEIGERGINLSGGQKQRVAVARAVYSDADLFLLDDPLSAVDVHVGKHLFERVFGPQGILAQRGATRVLITHGIHYLPKVDRIICLADKTIREQGTFEELVQMNGHFAQLVKQLKEENEKNEEEERQEQEAVPAIGETAAECAFVNDDDGTVAQGAHVNFEAVVLGGAMYEEPRSRAQSESEIRRQSSARQKPPKPDASKAKLMSSEDAATGTVSPKVYWWYLRAMNIPLCLVFLVFFVAYNGLQIFSNIWLSTMNDDQNLKNDIIFMFTDKAIISKLSSLISSGQITNPLQLAAMQNMLNSANQNLSAVNDDLYNRRDKYLWWYLGYGGFQALVVAVFSITFSFMVASASRYIHASMLDRLLHAPMSFFDTTPTGRILNRFTKDIDLIDFMMPNTFRFFLIMLGSIVSVFVVIAYSTPIFLAVLGPVLIVLLLILIVYLPTSRQLRRLESVTRSPVFSHVAETIQGRVTIQAYGEESRFIADQALLMDENNVYNLASFVANRFLGVFIDLATNLLVVAACAFAVDGRDNNTGLGAGKAALSLSYAISISTVANTLIRMMNDFEVNAVSIERTKEYTTIPQEASWEIEQTKPAPNWPDSGVVEFQDYSTRYREGLDLVIKNVNVKVQSMEKVGICGRTGAGKSSVTLALFRLIEAANGKIVIDGLHAEPLGLHHLRSRLTILPQEPVIFSQTLRFNLDPFDEHTDEAVWRSLELVHLKDHFSAPDEKTGKSKGLGFMVTEGGGNLSVGQRQLLCLARALLRRTKVLVLDEATAAVDYETDALIQATIRSEFKECTVLTIAHRINTIIDSDKILVLDRGRVREFDSPQNLLARGDSSVFFQMVQQAGALNSALASSANTL